MNAPDDQAWIGTPAAADPALSHLTPDAIRSLTQKIITTGDLCRQVNAADDAIADAQEYRDNVRDTAERNIRILGEEYRRLGLAIPRNILRTLYWDHPTIRVSEICNAAGNADPTALRRLVGPKTITQPCRLKCGTPVTWTPTSRSALATGDGNARSPWQDPRVCEPCGQRARTAQTEERRLSDAEQRKRDREIEAAVDAAIRAGDVTAEWYVFVPGYGDVVVDPEDPRLPS